MRIRLRDEEGLANGHGEETDTAICDTGFTLLCGPSIGQLRRFALAFRSRTAKSFQLFHGIGTTKMSSVSLRYKRLT